MDLQIALERIIALVTDITFIPFAVGLVLILTQLIKTAFKLDGSRAALTALGVQVVVWVLYSFFKARGMGDQFEQWAKALETIITTLAGVLFPAILSGLGTQAVYDRLSKKSVPGFRGSEEKAEAKESVLELPKAA